MSKGAVVNDRVRTSGTGSQIHANETQTDCSVAPRKPFLGIVLMIIPFMTFGTAIGTRIIKNASPYSLSPMGSATTYVVSALVGASIGAAVGYLTGKITATGYLMFAYVASVVGGFFVYSLILYALGG
ncbi:hypothetical protein [Desulfogranum marinum]|uniref:hypothetical protein n=1 Tax=Desulfogranum marinum TaxID=453220 RepID=UPI00196234FE|nr:hypothetical protein [Desulfogranum marinum]MBM9514733.1 hypothetical protein [Desulfogranum marinum]